MKSASLGRAMKDHWSVIHDSCLCCAFNLLGLRAGLYAFVQIAMCTSIILGITYLRFVLWIKICDVAFEQSLSAKTSRGILWSRDEHNLFVAANVEWKLLLPSLQHSLRACSDCQMWIYCFTKGQFLLSHIFDMRTPLSTGCHSVDRGRQTCLQLCGVPWTSQDACFGHARLGSQAWR